MTKNLTGKSRLLRKNSTDVEKQLWQKLRSRQLEGLKFRRQQQIGNFIVDFINLEKRIIIELDGGQHASEKDKDAKRDKWLQGEGFEVLRFWNNEVVENIDGVLEVIRKKLLSPSP